MYVQQENGRLLSYLLFLVNLFKDYGEKWQEDVLQLLNKHSQFVCKIWKLLLTHMSVLKILQSFIAHRGGQCS